MWEIRVRCRDLDMQRLDGEKRWTRNQDAPGGWAWQRQGTPNIAPPRRANTACQNLHGTPIIDVGTHGIPRLAGTCRQSQWLHAVPMGSTFNWYKRPSVYMPAVSHRRLVSSPGRHMQQIQEAACTRPTMTGSGDPAPRATKWAAMPVPAEAPRVVEPSWSLPSHEKT